MSYYTKLDFGNGELDVRMQERGVEGATVAITTESGDALDLTFESSAQVRELARALLRAYHEGKAGR